MTLRTLWPPRVRPRLLTSLQPVPQTRRCLRQQVTAGAAPCSWQAGRLPAARTVLHVVAVLDHVHAAVLCCAGVMEMGA
jgi:hypothetical protein